MNNSTIRPKQGTCIDCNNPGYLTAKRCQSCYQRHRAGVCKERAEKRGKSQHISGKEAKELDRQLEYARESKAWLKLPEHQRCEAGWQGCTIKATTVHHGKGRMLTKAIDFLLAKEFWKALCHHCHNGPKGVTEDSARAIKEGLSYKRNT